VEFKNEFSWSWSRHQAFERCKRLYWYQHYGFWGGWKTSSPAREIYIQKRLNSRPQWLGTKIHEAVEWTLREVRAGRRPPPRYVVDRTLEQARREIEDSARERYRENPKKYPGFAEHYYGQSVSSADWDETLGEMERQLVGFFDSAVFLRLVRVPQQIVEIEELQQVELAGVPVWVSLDVLVRDEAGGFVVIDWKTGAAHDPATVVQQLGVYAAYVRQRYMSDDGEVRVMYANLRHGDHEVRVVTGDLVTQAVGRIEKSASAMTSLLDDAAENIANVQSFPMLEEGSSVCATCVYRRSCERE
jgi:hypothetical protein